MIENSLKIHKQQCHQLAPRKSRYYSKHAKHAYLESSNHPIIIDLPIL
jgi:hypothetical protein